MGGPCPVYGMVTLGYVYLGENNGLRATSGESVMDSIMWDVFYHWVVPGGLILMFGTMVVGLILSAPWWPWN